MTIFNCILLLALVFGSFHANAQGCNDRVVYSVNGVLTSRDEAFNNAARLRDSYSINTRTAQIPEFRYLYNPSAKSLRVRIPGPLGIPGAFSILDFYETLVQRSGLGISRVFRILDGHESIPESIRPQFAQTLADFVVNTSTIDVTTLTAMSNTVINDIDRGRTVLLVAHSQGNLWANSLLVTTPIVQRRSAIAQIGVAVPDSRLERSVAEHITLVEDEVIGSIPTLLRLPTLPPNTVNGYSLGEAAVRFLGHNFVSAYLDARRESELKIVRAIDSSFPQLVPFVTSSSRCSSVEITDISCQASKGVMSWSIYGRARSGFIGDLLYASPLSASRNNPSIVSECDLWTDTFTFEGRSFCRRRESDPVATGWWADFWTTSLDTTSVTSSSLNGFETVISGLKCPGVFSCLDGVCQSR